MVEFDALMKPISDEKPAGEDLATFRVGAVIQATGWKPVEPRDHLPYGQVEDVIYELGRGLDPITVEGRFIWPDAVLQPVEEFETVGLMTKKRLHDVDVTLYEPGEHRGAAGIEDPSRFGYLVRVGLDLGMHMVPKPT